MNNVEPVFHPSADLLGGHASGWMSWAADLCVRVHLEGCSQCRRTVAGLEDAHAGWVDELPEAPPSEAALQALLARVQAAPVDAPPLANAVGGVTLPAAMAGVRLGRRRWAAPGFWVAHIPEGRRQGWRNYVMRAGPGQRLPMHRHEGPELICVLSGALMDGARYGAGDFIEQASGTEHDPMAGSEEPCICLVATKGPLQWRGAAKLIGHALSV